MYSNHMTLPKLQCHMLYLSFSCCLPAAHQPAAWTQAVLLCILWVLCRYATFAMGTAAEVAAVLVALLLVDRVGRHNVVSIGLLLGGGACLACAVVPGTTVVAALAAIGKFGCSGELKP